MESKTNFTSSNMLLCTYSEIFYSIKNATILIINTWKKWISKHKRIPNKVERNIILGDHGK